ncbi:DUF3558 domain-containing protein [Amycolatopsis sp. VS8301801F10]|uniref:DUF3558 domain-containing protein n=1 Tax=Amycolatopsis sp. VS8301801F10 TaxID=2652442 RepID=UPI0038FD11C8
MTKLTLGALLGGVLVLAGCSAAPTPPVVESSPPSEMPQPLNIRKFEQDPCALLPQVTEVFNAVRNRSTAGATIPACVWNDSKNSSLTIGFVAVPGGLAAAYQNGSSTGYFETAPPIGGYPAAFTNVVDNRSEGGCQIAVSVQAEEAFTSSVVLRPRSPSYGDPCAVAVNAAAAVVATLRASS